MPRPPRTPARTGRLLATVLAAALVVAAALPAAAVEVLHNRPDGLALTDLEDGTRRSTGIPARTAALSPDGTRIAYADDAGLWVADADGSGARLVLGEAEVGRRIAWFPDGQRLVVDRAAAEAPLLEVPLFDDGHGIVEGDTVPPGYSDLAPSVSPDGGSVAFVRLDRRTGFADLMIADRNPARPGSRTSPRVLSPQEVAAPLVQPPAWSPDGRQLAFVGYARTGPARGQRVLFTVGRDGAEPVPLVRRQAAQPQSVAWSPDGTLLAVAAPCTGACDDAPAAGAGSRIDEVDPATGGTRPITFLDDLIGPIAYNADGSGLVVDVFTQDSGCHCDLHSLLLVVVADGSVRALDQGEELLHVAPEPDVGPGVSLRAAGPSRFETAVAVSRAAFGTADTVVLARHDVYADALPGSALAGSLGAPLLLTDPDELYGGVLQEVRRLGAGQVLLLGDTTALSERVEEALVAEGLAVARIGGATRFDTARLVARRMPGDHAIVVRGSSPGPAPGWADAVAAGGLAGSLGVPLLLVEQDRLPAETAQALRDGGIREVTIVGGEPAVSAAVAQQIADLGIAVDRLEGETRYGTSAAVAEESVAVGLDPSTAVVVSGRDWPDALAAGPAAARLGGVLVLVDGVDARRGSLETWGWLRWSPPARALLVGGPDVLVPGIAVRLERDPP